MEGESKEMSEETHTINSDNIEAFRAAYKACEGESFMFGDREILKSYARYLILHWDASVRRGRRNN